MKIKICKHEQGSPQWHAARLGRITASTFSKIITPTGKRSSSTDEMVNRAVAELITGEPDEQFISDAMIRGQELEDNAFNYFNFAHDLGASKAGFVQAVGEDELDLYYGFSPDGENFANGFGLEIKCPLAHTHLGYLAGKELPKKYIQQLQGSMAISGAKRWFFGSYHPSFPAFSVWVERDDEYCQKILEILNQCHGEIKGKLRAIKEIMGEVA